MFKVMVIDVLWIWQRWIYLFNSYGVDKPHTRGAPISESTKWPWSSGHGQGPLCSIGVFNIPRYIINVNVATLGWFVQKSRITSGVHFTVKVSNDLDIQSQRHSFLTGVFTIPWYIINVSLATLGQCVETLLCRQASYKECTRQEEYQMILEVIHMK